MYPPDNNSKWDKDFMKFKPSSTPKTDLGIVIGLSLIAYLAILAVVIYLNVEATQWIMSLFG